MSVSAPFATDADWRRNKYSLLVAGAGAVILLLSLAAAMLPAIEISQEAQIVGGMMVLAGSVEAFAGALRSSNRGSSIAAGTITLLAGVLFFGDPFGAFVPMVRLVIAWLFARGIVLLFASVPARGSIRAWTLVAGATDVSLGGILFAGLSASAFPIALFGPTSDMVSGFAVVLAISFVATAMLLIEVAACEFMDWIGKPVPSPPPRRSG